MASPTPFPVENSTTLFWRTQLDALDSHRSTDELPVEADILIIGAGYAGAAVAHHLQNKTKDQTNKPSILILEARQACSGATGRNGGHFRPDVYARATAVIDRYGVEAAEEVVTFEVRNLAAIKELIEQKQIDCDFTMTQCTSVWLRAQDGDETAIALEKLTQVGISTVSDVTYTSEADAENNSGVKGAKACCSSSAAHLWPYKPILHILGNLIKGGANLQTHTPMHQVSSTPDSENRWTINTPRGQIKTRKVIYATNGYTAGIVPEIKSKIVPIRGICCRIVVPKDRPSPPQLTNSYNIMLNSWAYDYLIPRSDGSIVVGGARQRYYHDLDQWFENSDDSTLIESARNYYNGYMQRTFKGWEGSGAYVDQIWTGIMGYTHDAMPYVGELPNKPGQYICAGFTGHGMPQMYLSAECLAATIVENKTLRESGLPRLYELSQERLDDPDHRAIEIWNSIDWSE
ncbi:FAD dependent oxidoreductase [Acrodontium crateriforme]|uniref:FAD dependent oxidoreductase n=1 Tax=Acrodontium crateriforme TaxID=150365 RepID=A0AAQ3RB79_9PEZI|nr:FAD dependent oxidoreductase [Acrodontium crateriforme]